MKVNIDRNSGFCFGVVKAINKAEENLTGEQPLFCLGDIVHNQMEVQRLQKAGMIVISQQDLKNIYNTRVLIRAHGEPPETYEICRKNNLHIVDATCPVVLKLQKRIRKNYEHPQDGEQIVIYGKKGHAEVMGLTGQTGGEAILVENDFSGIEKIDFSKPISLYSQTTQSTEKYNELYDLILNKIRSNFPTNEPNLKVYHTICGRVANRGPQLAEFAREHDVIVFVSGKKSSNGKYLFGICKENNDRSYFVSDEEEINTSWFVSAGSAGVCGATSTPMWLMERVAGRIRGSS